MSLYVHLAQKKANQKLHRCGFLDVSVVANDNVMYEAEVNVILNAMSPKGYKYFIFFSITQA